MTQTTTVPTAEDAAACLADVLHLLDRLDESAQDMDPDLIRAAVPQALREWVTAKYPADDEDDDPAGLTAVYCTKCRPFTLVGASQLAAHNAEHHADATAPQPQPTGEHQADEPPVTALAVIQMGPAAKTAAGYECAIHLVRRTLRGTPGPTLCGIDRFGPDAPGWSFGGVDGPNYTQKPCTDCVAAAATRFQGLPVEGSIGSKEFRTALMGATHLPA